MREVTVSLCRPSTGPMGARFAAALGLVLALAACQPSKVAEPAKPAQPPPAAREVPETPQQPVGPVKVGLLLPLSGQHGEIGESLLNAAELALFDTAGRDFELVVQDTGGTAGGARAAAETALTEGARLLIGPLFSSGVEGVGFAAGAQGVNVVSLSNNPEFAGNNVFIIGNTPSSQVSRIVGYAASRGLRRFALIGPDNAYGAATIRALQTAAQGHRLEVANIVTYSASSPNLDEAARRLASGPSDSLGGPGFDALLMPDGGRTLLSLAPYLAYHDVGSDVVQYLGMSTWHDSSLTNEASLHGGLFAAPGRERWDSFRTRFREAFGTEPQRVATLAYDAVALAAVLARRADQENREVEYATASLTRDSGFNGLDGIFRFRPSGENQRGLAVFELASQGIRPVDPPPTSFEDLVF